MSELEVQLHGSVARCGIRDTRVMMSGTSEDVCNILLLREKITTGGIRYFYTEKVAQKAKVLHLKLILQVLFERRDSSGITASDDHVINIEDQDHNPRLSSAAKHGIICCTLRVADGEQRLTKSLKPSTRCLFESIES